MPGLYGYVSATKWLAELELTTLEAFDGYWVPLGWAKEAPILTQSRIDTPKGSVAAGRVHDRGHRLGAGPRRQPGRGLHRRHLARRHAVAADLGRDLGPVGAAWDATAGQHVIRVRATDGTGTVQEATRAGRRPTARAATTAGPSPSADAGGPSGPGDPAGAANRYRVRAWPDVATSSIHPNGSSPARSASPATGRSSCRPATARRITSVALEKVQVAVLAERLGQLLAELDRRGVPGAHDAVEADLGDLDLDLGPLDEPLNEAFRAGSLTLGWDGDDGPHPGRGPCPVRGRRGDRPRRR